MPQDRNPTVDHEEKPSCPAAASLAWHFEKDFFVFFVLRFG